jgi:hypothetical protein
MQCIHKHLKPYEHQGGHSIPRSTFEETDTMTIF